MSNVWDYLSNKASYEKLKLAQSGQVIQLRKYKFAFSLDKRLDVIIWLEENNVECSKKDGLHVSFATIHDGTLAMEFKLRFLNV